MGAASPSSTGAASPSSTVAASPPAGASASAPAATPCGGAAPGLAAAAAAAAEIKASDSLIAGLGWGVAAALAAAVAFLARRVIESGKAQLRLRAALEKSKAALGAQRDAWGVENPLQRRGRGKPEEQRGRAPKGARRSFQEATE
jgi:hypothetical protein